MNAMTGVATQGAETLAGTAAAPHLYTLRRTGRKAMRFSGWKLVEAKGVGESDSVYYDLGIYRSDADAIIVELIARRSLVEEQDICRVEVFADLSQASCWLESYVVANDVPIPPALAAGNGSVAAAVLKSIQLRQHMARIEDDYHGLLSDVFDALDIADTPDVHEKPLTEAVCEAEV